PRYSQVAAGVPTRMCEGPVVAGLLTEPQGVTEGGDLQSHRRMQDGPSGPSETSDGPEGPSYSIRNMERRIQALTPNPFTGGHSPPDESRPCQIRNPKSQIQNAAHAVRGSGYFTRP